MRMRTIDAARIERVLADSRRDGATVLKNDDRSRVTAVDGFVVKDFSIRRPLQCVADCFRGSPARRAWLGGHGLRARGIGAATPVAFVERRTFGVPTASTVVLEDLRQLASADAVGPERASPEQVVHAVVRLAIELHRREVVHGDLKASHVLLEPTGESGKLDARLIDLDGVRFPRRLDDRARLQALAELNASLPDEISDALRCAAFQRYAAAVPFRAGTDTAMRRIVEISLARRHRWTGAQCEVASRLREDFSE